jgi:hypothetical protein
LAQLIVTAQEPSLEHVNLKKYRKKMPMGTNSQVPLAHRLKCHHLLDAVRVEVLQLEPILEENSADEPPSGDEEAALVEGHERDHEPLGARHGLFTRNLPLHGGGERRKLAHLDEMQQLLAGHVGARPVQHRGGGISGGLEVQEVTALRMRRSAGSRM